MIQVQIDGDGAEEGVKEVGDDMYRRRDGEDRQEAADSCTSVSIDRLSATSHLRLGATRLTKGSRATSFISRCDGRSVISRRTAGHSGSLFLDGHDRRVD